MDGQTRIEDWALVMGKGWDGYTAPEITRQQLKGRVYDHPEKVDGVMIRTSDVVSLDLEVGIATTVSRIYILGKPHHRYAEQMEAKGYPATMKYLKRFEEQT